MNILNMSKQDFANVPYLDTYSDWKKLAPNGHLEFNSLVIIPVENEDGTIDLHDSGWGCMAFCLIGTNDEPIGKIGGCLRVWSRNHLFINDRGIYSSMEVFAEDEPRRNDEQ